MRGIVSKTLYSMVLLCALAVAAFGAGTKASPGADEKALGPKALSTSGRTISGTNVTVVVTPECRSTSTTS